MAEYDFMENVQSNASMSSCMDLYLEGNYLCMRSVVAQYNELYGINGLSIISASNQADKSYNTSVNCFPYALNSSVYTVCLSESGD